MTKRQDLCLQRRSRPEQSDQRQPNQPANISHQPGASPDSTSLASRIEFPTMTAVCRCSFGPQPLDNLQSKVSRASIGHAHPHPTPRFLHPREVHQRTIPREATRQGIFRVLSEGSISDRGRKLAGASVSEYRVYDEAAQTASQIMSWSRAFDKPIIPP